MSALVFGCKPLGLNVNGGQDRSWLAAREEWRILIVLALSQQQGGQKLSMIL
jgi:hypothetical protein